MNISWFEHSLQWWLYTWDPHFVNKLKDQDFLLYEFEKQNSIIYNWDNFLVVSKAAPYSSEDFMIIYSWKDSNKTSIYDLNKIEIWELFSLLGHLNKKLLIDFDNDFKDWKKELILWINTSLLPGNWNIQSVSRPHFHLTILSKVEQNYNNVNTRVLDILKNNDDHISGFCIRDINNQLIDEIIVELDNSKIVSSKYIKTDIWCLDIDLYNHDELFSNANQGLINSVYHFIYAISKYRFWLKDWVNSDKNSFSMWFKKIDWKYKMRIRFFHKMPWDAGWVMESFNHLIIRNRVENPLLPDIKDFNKKISSYF